MSNHFCESVFESRWTQKPLGNDVVFFSLHHACTTCGFPTRLGVKKEFIFFLSNTHKRVRSEDIYELNVLHNRIQYVAVVIKKVLLS